VTEAALPVKPLHTTIQGRGRFKVKGLRGCPALGPALEAGLRRCDGIDRITTSAVTGTVLVIFSAQWTHAQIEKEIAALLQSWLRSHPLATGAGCRPAPRASGQGDLPHQVDSVPVEPSAEAWLQAHTPWHRMKTAEVFEKLQVSRATGLDSAIARQRMQTKGPNTIKQHVTETALQIFMAQFHSLPLLLLGAEAVLALVSGALVEAAAVGGIVAANAAIGGLIDWRSQKLILSARAHQRPMALVVRDGRTCQLPGEQLVPGDLLVLKPGTFVGADSRIISADNLKIDESLLTGESIPVDKTARTMKAAAGSVVQRRNMAFMGTLVVGGQGICVVVATGDDTQFGRMQSLLVETLPPDTFMTRKLNRITHQLMRIGVWIGAVALGIGFLRGLSLLRALRAALSLTATSIPAGLPSAATANLAIGVRNLQARKIGVHRLVTLENLGSVNMVCFDKTGTITRSRISVLRLFVARTQVGIKDRKFYREGRQVNPLEDADLQHLIQVGVLCNESRIESRPGTGRMVLTGSPTEKALLFMGVLARADVFGIYKQFRLIRVVHRGEFRRRMLTVHVGSGRQQLVSVKGDPLEVLRLCSRQLVNGRTIALGMRDTHVIESENDAMAADGLRVLGFAYKLQTQDSPGRVEKDFIWIGLVGIAEPIREGARTLMAYLHRAEMKTVMITGDQSLTAQAVANRIRLARRQAPKSMDSSNFESIPPELLEALVRDVQVFTRVNPSQKLQIVQAYQKAGYSVAMTGDGINDGPALRAADVGIAMGLSGTDVAREVADLVLQDDNLLNLAAAVHTSRAAELNLKKAVRYFLTANFSDTMLALGTLAAGGTSQAPSFNIVPDIFPGMALLKDPVAAETVSGAAPAKSDPMFAAGQYRSMAVQAAVLCAAGLGAYAAGALRHGMGSRAALMAFESHKAAKILHACNCRQADGQWTDSDAAPPPSAWFNTALAGSIVFQLSTLLMPGLRRLTGRAVLDLADISVCAAAAVVGLLVNRTAQKPKPAQSE
jgi:Ca2+-transporting ATPase